MKLAILASGTRGDVQPYIALGKALGEQGHDVRLVCPDNFEAWIRSHGLAFFPLGVDMQAFLQLPEGRKVLSGNPFTVIKIWKKMIVPFIQEMLNATWKFARDADVIIYHPKVACAVDVAEATGALLVSTAPFPIFPTKVFPFLMFRGNFGPRLNRLSYIPLLLSRLFLPSTALPTMPCSSTSGQWFITGVQVPQRQACVPDSPPSFITQFLISLTGDGASTPLGADPDPDR